MIQTHIAGDGPHGVKVSNDRNVPDGSLPEAEVDVPVHVRVPL